MTWSTVSIAYCDIALGAQGQRDERFGPAGVSVQHVLDLALDQLEQLVRGGAFQQPPGNVLRVHDLGSEDLAHVHRDLIAALDKHALQYDGAKLLAEQLEGAHDRYRLGGFEYHMNGQVVGDGAYQHADRGQDPGALVAHPDEHLDHAEQKAEIAAGVDDELELVGADFLELK